MVLVSLKLQEYHMTTGTVPYECYIKDCKIGFSVIKSV